jgi:Serine protease inhibitor
MSDDRVSRALDALSREPVASWPEPAAVRQRAARRRRRRRIVAPGAAVAVAVAITLGVVLPGSSGPATPAPRVAVGQHVAARSGVALQLAADTQSIAKSDPSAAAAVARTEQAFTLALLQHLDASGAPGNVVLSPSSVAVALAMLQNGAAGSTLTEIAHALHSQGLSTQQQDAGWATLTAELAAAGKSGGVTLQSANSLWLQHGLQMQNPFMAAMARYFDTGVWQVDFAKDLSGAINAINSWTSTHTRGKITKLFQPGDIDQTTELVLADAVYFDAAWKYAFDPNKTAPGTFTTSEGSKVKVSFMHLDVDNEATVARGLLVGSGAGY